MSNSYDPTEPPHDPTDWDIDREHTADDVPPCPDSDDDLREQD